MSLIIATGTNQGDKIKNLKSAIKALKKHFKLIKESRVYTSPAVDYYDQPDFYNQVIEFELPKNLNPDEVMDILLEIERKEGRVRDPNSQIKGPRIIDIDILFFGLEKHPGPKAIVPHPRLFDRSFVVLPLIELPYFETLKRTFVFKDSFDNSAKPI